MRLREEEEVEEGDLRFFSFLFVLLKKITNGRVMLFPTVTICTLIVLQPREQSQQSESCDVENILSEVDSTANGWLSVLFCFSSASRMKACAPYVKRFA